MGRLSQIKLVENYSRVYFWDNKRKNKRNCIYYLDFFNSFIFNFLLCVFVTKFFVIQYIVYTKNLHKKDDDKSFFTDHPLWYFLSLLLSKTKHFSFPWHYFECLNVKIVSEWKQSKCNLFIHTRKKNTEKYLKKVFKSSPKYLIRNKKKLLLWLLLQVR